MPRITVEGATVTIPTVCAECRATSAQTRTSDRASASDYAAMAAEREDCSGCGGEGSVVTDWPIARETIRVEPRFRVG